MRSLSVIIPAAGSGVRMGAEVPKPFIKLGDRTILEHTISRFTESPLVGQIIIATSASYVTEIEAMQHELPDSISFHVVEGGSERQYSIFNALKVVSKDMKFVAVHDAVRPFIRAELIAACVEVAREKGGAVVGVPAKDTIKKVNKDELITSTPDRSYLWQAQTPQVFQRSLLMKAYESALQDDFVGTDDASLVERIGGEVKMVMGDRENLKITYPIDLQIAELILGART